MSDKSLARILEMVKDLNTSNSLNDKREKLAKYSDIKDLLLAIYDKKVPFHITSEALIKFNKPAEDVKITLEELLDKLAKREITGDKAKAVTKAFVQQNPEHSITLYRILDKNLECGIGLSTIQTVFNTKQGKFDVQLAKTFSEKDFGKHTTWYASRKLDGVRLLTIVRDGSVEFFSRQGKAFTTLDVLKKDIVKFATINKLTSFVLDGELCIIDEETGLETFKGVMKEIRRKNHTIKNPKFKIFDLLTVDEFSEGKGSTNFSERYAKLKALKLTDTMDVLEQKRIADKSAIDELMDLAKKSGWEGLIVRADTPYKGKRSNALLKVKDFFDAEYVVKDVEFGMVRYIGANGLETKEEMLSNVVIEHKGNKVGVGSGFSIEERKRFHKNPEAIIGKTITVQYFEETKNKDGKISLRFPTVKFIYDNGRNV
jgi:DNA ligase-1